MTSENTPPTHTHTTTEQTFARRDIPSRRAFVGIFSHAITSRRPRGRESRSNESRRERARPRERRPAARVRGRARRASGVETRTRRARAERRVAPRRRGAARDDETHRFVRRGRRATARRVVAWRLVRARARAASLVASSSARDVVVVVVVARRRCRVVHNFSDRFKNYDTLLVRLETQ